MNDPDREEEFLCDYAASELIMPSSYFFRDVRYLGPSLGAVFELARRYQASLRATVIKFAEMSLWKCAFFFWRLRREGNKSGFHLESCTRHGDLREGVSLSHKHLLTTLESGQIVRGKEQVKIRNLEETCYVESVRIGSSSSSRVLSMIFADPHARHLAYASNQNLEQPIRQRRLFEDNDDSN
jgi:hypothetical protein